MRKRTGTRSSRSLFGLSLCLSLCFSTSRRCLRRGSTAGVPVVHTSDRQRRVVIEHLFAADHLDKLWPLFTDPRPARHSTVSAVSIAVAVVITTTGRAHELRRESKSLRVNVRDTVALNALTPCVGRSSDISHALHAVDDSHVSVLNHERDNGRELRSHAALKRGIADRTRRRPADKSTPASTLRERVPRRLTPDRGSRTGCCYLRPAKQVSQQVLVQFLAVSHL